MARPAPRPAVSVGGGPSSSSASTERSPAERGRGLLRGAGVSRRIRGHPSRPRSRCRSGRRSRPSRSRVPSRESSESSPPEPWPEESSESSEPEPWPELSESSCELLESSSEPWPEESSPVRGRSPPWSSPGSSSETPGGRSPPWSSPGSLSVGLGVALDVGLELGVSSEVAVALVGERNGSRWANEALPSRPTSAGTVTTMPAARTIRRRRMVGSFREEVSQRGVRRAVTGGPSRSGRMPRAWRRR